MDVWDVVSRDVFVSLIKDVSEKCQDQHEEDVRHEEHGPSILDVLPIEILQKILQYLPNKDLLTLRLACHEMKTAASAPEVLKLRVEQYLLVSHLDDEFMQPILPNIASMTLSNIYDSSSNSAEDEDDDDDDENRSALKEEVPGRILQKLADQCLNLRSLEICNTTIPSTESLGHHERLVERLTTLKLQSVTLESVRFLSATYPRLTEFVICGCFFRGEKPFEGIPEVRMNHLKALDVSFIDRFQTDECRHLTGGNLVNLEQLVLTHVNAYGMDFISLKLTNLKKLDVNACQFGIEWLSQLKHLRRLQELSMSSLVFDDDACPADVFTYCTQLELLHLDWSDFGNRLVSYMARYLPNLKRWVMRSREDGIVTDEAFNGMIYRTSLEEVIFDRIQLTDVGLRQIVLLSPNLKEMSVSICAAGDDTMAVVGQLKSLVSLTLRGCRISDAGFAQLEPRFAEFEELVINSRHASSESICVTMPLLKCIRQLDLELGDPECVATYYENSHLRLRNLPSDVSMYILRRFKGAMTVVLDGLSICELAIDEQLRISMSGVYTFTVKNCEFTEDVATALAAVLKDVTEFSLYEFHMSEAVVRRFVEGITVHGQVQQVYIETEQFLSNDALKAIMQMTSTCIVMEIRNFDYEKVISFINRDDRVEVHVNAGDQIDDDVIEEIARRMPKTEAVVLTDTAITSRGLARAGKIFTGVEFLSVKSSTLGDDVVAVIGQGFRRVTYLTLNCEHITDDGLEVLGQHMTELLSLTITSSAITDEGVRKLVPKLPAVASLTLSGNLKLTRELYDYLTETYPDLHQQAFPEQEAEENDDDNGQQEQYDAVAVEIVEAEAAAEAEAEDAEHVGNLALDLADVPRENRHM